MGRFVEQLPGDGDASIVPPKGWRGLGVLTGGSMGFILPRP
jgi:hypothetical protein